ncbi:MAG TPA: cytochrome c oxidase subunit 3 [Casimicrobiaceae bacterium]|nr:cytochrome c oxidase subunit 3 [Casimicrobiaceae bacterium]
MTTPLILLSLIMAIVVGWLVRKTLNTAPWVEQRAVETAGREAALTLLPVQVGLWAFLAVATSLFALLIAAYHMRMDESDWTSLALPKVLWLNTVVLVLASAAMQWTLGAARRGQAEVVRKGLASGGIFSFAFLAGQIWAWQQLKASGHYSASNPAFAFFVLLTAVHGLHLLGGLVVWARAAVRAARGADFNKVRLSVELCTVYWHFLLVVWVCLFAVLLYSHR